MRSRWVKTAESLLCGAVLALCAGSAAHAQAAVPVQAITGELAVLASHAATVFVGQIVAVERKGSVVEVQFRVEQTIRGAAGATFTLREWSGLWPQGHTRYTVGERVLAFLNGNSAAGLSSPVHGAEGLVPVRVEGANAPQLLDVRRVAASVVRAPGTSLPTEANGAMPLSEAIGWINAPTGGGAAGRGLLPVPTRGRKPVFQQGTGSAEPVSTPVAVPGGPQPMPVDGLGVRRALPVLQEESRVSF